MQNSGSQERGFHRPMLLFRDESVYKDSRGRDCISRNATARILGVSPQAVLDLICRRKLPAEHRGHMGTAVWLIPVRAVELYTVNPKQQAIGRIPKRWPVRARTTCDGCGMNRKVNLNYRCAQCAGEV